MLTLAEAEEHHLFPCFNLIAYTGMRHGEALGLTWDNVNLESGYIHIVASLAKTRERGFILEPP